MPRRKFNNKRNKQRFEKLEEDMLSRMEKRRKVIENNDLRKKKTNERWYIHRKRKRLLSVYYKKKEKATPHPLVVINAVTFSKIKDNSIIVRNLNRENRNSRNCSDGGNTTYQVEFLGHNLHPLMTKCHDHFDTQNIGEISGGFITILCDINDECMQDDCNITFVPLDGKGDGAYVMLMFLVANMEQYVNTSDTCIWHNDRDLKLLRKFKKNTIKSSKKKHHYGSKGYCYSFGLRNAYSTSISHNMLETQIFA
jgi:hypothetical protein